MSVFSSSSTLKAVGASEVRLDSTSRGCREVLAASQLRPLGSWRSGWIALALLPQGWRRWLRLQAGSDWMQGGAVGRSFPCKAEEGGGKEKEVVVVAVMEVLRAKI